MSTAYKTPTPSTSRTTSFAVFSDDDPSGVFDIAELDDEVPPDERGRVIAGRYEIMERIGEGGMGQVLRVRHRRLGKQFALKLMQAELTLDDDARLLFATEARVASALCHPNIVSVIDFGEDPDWGLFLTMELIEGESLKDRIERVGRVDTAVACQVAAQIASALAHSHSMNVVHSDVKADNVICVGAGEADWHVKLLDFGTAALATHNDDPNAEIVGTPEYVAPERITGGSPRPSNDIYSLGVLLYELLTGSLPFESHDTIAVLKSHIHDVPEPVGARRGEVLDDQLEAIVACALDKDPTRRYETAAELAADLEEYMNAVGARQRELEQRFGIAECTREEAAADAFDALDVAAAGLDADGSIRVANPAFARLVSATDPHELKGRSVVATELSTLHPAIREDVRIVAMTGKLIRRRVRVVSSDGTRESTLRLVLTPSRGRCGACMLTVQPLPVARG